MSDNASHYDENCLQRLLDDALPDALASEVAEHVAECSECRGRLESLAGKPQWWAAARHGVKKILSNPSAYASIRGDGRSLSESSAAVNREELFADFAVECLAPSDDPAMLGRLGEYEIVEVIGHGGMGIVLKGYQEELKRYVAVKVLAPHLALSGAARKRFAREAQATAAVVHPHVMAIHAVAAGAPLPYLVMPFVPCESLQDRLDRQGALEVRDILRIGLQAAQGLAAAHGQGLVHRDVKPGNILLEASIERVKLTDFGLARAIDDASLTRTGIITGTPQYMSPEQANGDSIDHRSDLFSLGSVLYAMCTGRPPFRAETTFGVLRRICEGTPRSIREVNADIPEWLEQIVLRLLSKDPAQRMGSAFEVASLLEQCLAHVQQPTSTPLPASIRTSTQSRARKLHAQVSLRNRVRWLRWLALPLVVAILLVAALSQISPNSSELPEAPAPRDIMIDEAPMEPIPEWNATTRDLDVTAEAISPDL